MHMGFQHLPSTCTSFRFMTVGILFEANAVNLASQGAEMNDSSAPNRTKQMIYMYHQLFCFRHFG